MTTSIPKLAFDGRILLLGSGSVSQCLQPLLLRHLDMDFTRLTVMDFEDLAHTAAEVTAAGGTYVRERITEENIETKLAEYVGEGDLLINLAWNIDTCTIIDWCQRHGTLYVDTSVEEWDPYADQLNATPQSRTLYARHMKLREKAKSWRADGPTAVVEHGANPGLVSHWTKVALIDIATAMLKEPERLARPLDEAHRTRLEEALANRDFAALGKETGTKVIHISERDTQVGDKPKQVGEFVNTWSVEGFYEEGIAPAELGWGTHEPSLPEHAYTHESGPQNQICLAQTGITTYVRSWVPIGGPIIGMVVRHGEAFTISDHLTVWEDGKAVYRPTVHYAYLPTDAAMNSLYECRMNGYELQTNQRIMNDEIVSGRDELGVLLLGHELNGWWVGSQLTIDESRALVAHQNATTLQVAASVLGAVYWMVQNPNKGLCVPDDLDHETVLSVANPYLGASPSVHTDWTPRSAYYEPFANFRPASGDDSEPWAFANFLVS
ncbi:saccharopine dehydrogenase NADP-binding domain-containing protein [Catellatospora tritici]|uniref:saccharopine dehydrogenase NADP-binding domain-containing protein n=1 Tax=Catellatospora tritici TaxID=2851566 RepID=UPI001C2DE4ED|nr:saccharopine dehydrogenase NADP-binding domain-containing protein [Catellatospora tritici]MBV1850234.1 saccharopine dehydrogenase NADP-binding domain-containing protein [Catellatospora tritici]